MNERNVPNRLGHFVEHGKDLFPSGHLTIVYVSIASDFLRGRPPCVPIPKIANAGRD